MKDIVHEGDRVLFLDNSHNRTVQFIRQIKPMHPKCLYISRNYRDGVNQIIQMYNRTEVMFLDYNLERLYRRTRMNGELLACAVRGWLTKSESLRTIVIHSWNPWGRRRMEKILKTTGKEVIVQRIRWMI